MSLSSFTVAHSSFMPLSVLEEGGREGGMNASFSYY